MGFNRNLIHKAIGECKSQKELARRMKEPPEKISYLANRAKNISLTDILKIEAATNGVITRYHFATSREYKLYSALEKGQKTIETLRLSERGMMAHAFAQEKGERRGRPSKKSRNSDALTGRTDEITARHYGFPNKDALRKTIKVVTHGTQALVNAMDNKTIALSVAAQIADFPTAEQEKIVAMDKPTRTTYLKTRKPTPAPSEIPTAELIHLRFNLLMLCAYLTHYIEESSSA